MVAVSDGELPQLDTPLYAQILIYTHQLVTLRTYDSDLTCKAVADAGLDQRAVAFL
jgi:hypothetical protein